MYTCMCCWRLYLLSGTHVIDRKGPYKIWYKQITVISYHLICNTINMPLNELTLTLLTALLLTFLITYFQLSGWRYTPDVLTNQNNCYIPKFNDDYIIYEIGIGFAILYLIFIKFMKKFLLWNKNATVKHCTFMTYSTSHKHLYIRNLLYASCWTLVTCEAFQACFIYTFQIICFVIDLSAITACEHYITPFVRSLSCEVTLIYQKCNPCLFTHHLFVYKTNSIFLLFHICKHSYPVLHVPPA